METIRVFLVVGSGISACPLVIGEEVGVKRLDKVLSGEILALVFGTRVQ